MCKCEILYLEQMVLGAYVDPANSGFRYSVLVFGGKHLPDPDYPIPLINMYWPIVP